MTPPVKISQDSTLEILSPEEEWEEVQKSELQFAKNGGISLEIAYKKGLNFINNL